jgi:hypothetical protein
VLEIGRNSVSPSTTPRINACKATQRSIPTPQHVHFQHEQQR